MGADAVLVSGCHPGDCHYTAGNYHARRRWMLFRQLLETLGIETERVHFTWISAAEGKKWQQVIDGTHRKDAGARPLRGLSGDLRGQGMIAATTPNMPTTAERRNGPGRDRLRL